MEQVQKINSFQDIFTDSHTLLRFVGNFFKHIDSSIKVDLELGFEYDVLTHTLLIGLEKFLAPNHLENITHKNLLHEMNYNYDNYCTYETFCIIHEMGHSVMGDLYGRDNFWKMLFQYNKQVEENRYLYECKIITYEELQRKYMKLQLERDANDFAMLFLLENTDIVKQDRKSVV